MISIKICKVCKEEKSYDEYSKNGNGGLRGTCKTCNKNKMISKINKDPYEHRLYVMASSMLKRIKYCKDDKNKHLKCYKDNNIECKLGKSVEEIKKILDENFKEDILSIMKEGKTPSVDRIDSKKDYELGNIRIIDYLENSKLGFISANESRKNKIKATYSDGTIVIFESIREAERVTKVTRRTISRLALNNNIHKTKKIKFEYYKG